MLHLSANFEYVQGICTYIQNVHLVQLNLSQQEKEEQRQQQLAPFYDLSALPAGKKKIMYEFLYKLHPRTRTHKANTELRFVAVG